MNKAKNIIDTDVSFENLALASIGKKPTHANKKGKVSPFIKSPLRYPGGKSRAVSQIIDQYIPKGLPALCSPFVGGGSIELALTSRGTMVYAYDAFEPLVHFCKLF